MPLVLDANRRKTRRSSGCDVVLRNTEVDESQTAVSLAVAVSDHSDVTEMLAVKHGYRDISPVTLEVLGGVVSASLYCGEVDGLPAGLVDSFLAELYRCKVCQFTCSLKASISSHLQLRHLRTTAALPSPGSCIDKVGGAKDGDAHGGAVPYQLDLNGEAKPSDEDEDFLLYDMLDNMSPPSCDISSERGLQVAHTCEVSTLFEESSIFPLKEASADVSCSIDPSPTQEDMAQSAHLMTLGLCRISSAKASPRSSACPTAHPPPETAPPLSQPAALKWNHTADHRRRPSRKQRLRCCMCPLLLPSRRLLDIHVHSHQASGGFGCVCCSWKADSWEELEPHWRSHCRRREQKEEKKRRKLHNRKAAESKALRRQKINSSAVQKVLQQTPESYVQHHHDNHSDTPHHRLCGQEEANNADSQSGQAQKDSLKNISKKKKDEERWSCSVCHRKFSTKLTLRRHMGIHQGDKPFTCPHCSYSSRLKASLLQHLRTHTGEKPYRCPECAYASIDRSSLLRHYRTHSHEKPYKCQQCSYSSIQKKSLDLHARRHHTGEAFPCQQCDYSSPDRQLLLRHVRTHHASSQHASL